MKKLKIFFLLLISLKVDAQKTIYYNNDENEIISKSEFKKLYGQSGYELKTETDTSVIYTKIRRVKEDSISLKDLGEIKQHLQNSSGSEISDNDIIIVNYFPGKDACNSTGDVTFVQNKVSSYVRKIKLRNNLKQFFIYKEKQGTERLW